MHLLNTEDNRTAVYFDKTWISQNHSNKYIWHDSRGKSGLKIYSGQGGWLTTAHMRSANIGFISGAKLVFYAGKSFINSGYHIEMHGEIFKAWFVGMLHLLKERSIIVMDSVSYHST